MTFNYKYLKHFDGVNWIDFYIILGKLSKCIRTKNNETEKYLLLAIYYTMCFAKQNDIDLDLSKHILIS